MTMGNYRMIDAACELQSIYFHLLSCAQQFADLHNPDAAALLQQAAHAMEPYKRQAFQEADHEH